MELMCDNELAYAAGFASDVLFMVFRPDFHAFMQDYWPAVVKFAQRHTVASDDFSKQEDSEGVAAAVDASQAGVKPPAAAGPFVSDSSQPADAPTVQAVKKEL